MYFTWSQAKSDINLKKHHITFGLAIRVFLDPNHAVIYDQKHSVDEERYITIGYVEYVSILVVYTVVDDDTYRIISARKALKYEVEKYYLF